MDNPKFCPMCGCFLNRNHEGFLACVPSDPMKGEWGPGGDHRCGKFVHWNNPAPCVAVLMPVLKLEAADLPIQHQKRTQFEGHDGLQPNAVILVKRGVEPQKGKWCLPCGFINAHEDPRDAAMREVMEEASAKIELMRVLETTRAFDQKANQIIIFYMARLIDGGAGDDAVGLGWFKDGELPDLAFETHRRIIEEYFAGKWKYTGNMSARIRLSA